MSPATGAVAGGCYNACPLMPAAPVAFAPRPRIGAA
jgi:hypothetical protein